MVYATLKDDIIRARYRPDDVLIEAELAERFECSKTPVREALQLLVNDGVINVIPRKGYVVRHLGVQDVRDVFEVRIALESNMAASAARHVEPADIDELRSLLAIQKSRSGVEALTDAAREFHIRLLDTARNARAKAILLPLFDETTRMHHLVPLTAQYLDSDEETRGHELILQALLDRDPAAAQQLMHAHVSAVRETAMRGLLGI